MQSCVRGGGVEVGGGSAAASKYEEGTKVKSSECFHQKTSGDPKVPQHVARVHVSDSPARSPEERSGDVQYSHGSSVQSGPSLRIRKCLRYTCTSAQFAASAEAKTWLLVCSRLHSADITFQISAVGRNVQPFSTHYKKTRQK